MILIWRKGFSGGRFPAPGTFRHRMSGYDMPWKGWKQMDAQIYFDGIQIDIMAFKGTFEEACEKGVSEKGT